MLTLLELRKLDSELDSIEDNELESISSTLYQIGELAFEQWLKERVSKNPSGLLTPEAVTPTI